MKNQQKGFVVPLIIFTISLVLVGGGVNYYYSTKNSNLVSDKQNYVWNKEEGLVWTKCDYGLAGKACNIPNYCGYDGTSQDSHDIKIENDPVCDPTKNVTFYGKGIRAKSDPVLDNSRYVYEEDSGVASCDNGVLCQDGAFIVVDWNDDYLRNKDEYNNFVDITQKEYVEVTDEAKERACTNHGGVAIFGTLPIYDWELPTIEELETLYDTKFEGINSKLFPNTSSKLMSITRTVGDVPNKSQILNFKNTPDNLAEISNGDFPLKCVFRVEPEEVEEEKTDEYSAKTKTVIEELNKMKLCEYICNVLKEDEQKKYLKKFDLLPIINY